MLDDLTIESFQPYTGTSFWVQHGTHKIELRLTGAAKVMESEAARLKRNPFSLYFLAPLYLPQATYTITHDSFPEPLEIFLVPVAQQGTAYAYEAVFT